MKIVIMLKFKLACTRDFMSPSVGPSVGQFVIPSVGWSVGLSPLVSDTVASGLNEDSNTA